MTEKEIMHAAMNELCMVIGGMKVSMIRAIAQNIYNTFIYGNKLMICGCGGSAADAQHLSAELVGRFSHDRPGMAAVALTTDTSLLTAVGNDFGFDHIYSRQVDALSKPGDLLLAISTSGKSLSVLNAIETAKSQDVDVVALTGENGSKSLKRAGADLVFAVPSQNTARIQEVHGLVIHIMCELIDEWLQI